MFTIIKKLFINTKIEVSKAISKRIGFSKSTKLAIFPYKNSTLYLEAISRKIKTLVLEENIENNKLNSSKIYDSIQEYLN